MLISHCQHTCVESSLPTYSSLIVWHPLSCSRLSSGSLESEWIIFIFHYPSSTKYDFRCQRLSISPASSSPLQCRWSLRWTKMQIKVYAFHAMLSFYGTFSFLHINVELWYLVMAFPNHFHQSCYAIRSLSTLINLVTCAISLLRSQTGLLSLLKPTMLYIPWNYRSTIRTCHWCMLTGATHKTLAPNFEFPGLEVIRFLPFQAFPLNTILIMSHIYLWSQGFPVGASSNCYCECRFHLHWQWPRTHHWVRFRV